MRINLILALVVLISSFAEVNAQTKEELALKGITLIDLKQYQAGIKELRKARNLDPSDYELTLELGRAFLLWEKPRKAQDYLNLLLLHPERTEELFLLLSRSAAASGKERPLNQGLVEFPEAGALFSEMGKVLASKDKLDEAIAYWEKGIEVDPTFSDNYLYASRIYIANDQFFWGWLYGETYINLRHEDQLQPEFVNAVQNAFRRSITLAAVSKPKDELGAMIHEVASSCASEDKPKQLTVLDERLACLMSKWAPLENTPFNVPLFSFYKTLIEKQQLEPYLFWLYSSTNANAYHGWLNSNKSKFEQFSNWMYWNGLELSENNRFVKLK